MRAAGGSKKIQFTGVRRRESTKLLFLIALGLLTGSCQPGVPTPVAIAPEDMCDYCKMSISERRFAAEFIDREGRAFKFDDITCLTGFLKRKGSQSQVAARFVADFDTREWLKAEDAFYVQSSEIKTPMGGGMIAFRNESQAHESADNYRGRLLRFDEVFNNVE